MHLTSSEPKRKDMDVDSLNFKGNNPGAVKHGNFINYYQFHSPESRLEVLPTDFWKCEGEDPLVCLDVGCNAGDLTVCLQERLSKTHKKCHILAVDLDPTLIKRAKEKHPQDNIEFHYLDFMDCCARNETFSGYLKPFGKRKFDVVFCFSVTMWIHLNEGDDGLRDFLEELCRISDMIVVEPQPWKCYRAAVKRLRLSDREFPHFEHLKLRGDIEVKIAEIITGQNFYVTAETGRTKWGRKLLIFKNK